MAFQLPIRAGKHALFFHIFGKFQWKQNPLWWFSKGSESTPHSHAALNMSSKMTPCHFWHVQYAIGLPLPPRLKDLQQILKGLHTVQLWETMLCSLRVLKNDCLSDNPAIFFSSPFRRCSGAFAPLLLPAIAVTFYKGRGLLGKNSKVNWSEGTT